MALHIMGRTLSLGLRTSRNKMSPAWCIGGGGAGRAYILRVLEEEGGLELGDSISLFLC